MKNILFITAFHPYAIGDIGAGESICGDNLNKLIKEGNQVDVLVIVSKRQCANPEIVKLCNSYHVIDDSPVLTFKALIKNIKYGAIHAPWFFTRVNPKSISFIENALKKNVINQIWIDFPSVLGFSSYISNIPITYFAHDVVYQRIARGLIKKFLFPFVKKIESRLLLKMSRVYVLSSKDEALVRCAGFSGEIEIESIQPQKVGIVNASKPIKLITNQFVGKVNLVFFGNMKRSENHYSIVNFIIFHFYKLLKYDNSIHLWILGINPRFSLRLLSKIFKNVHISGAVDDPIPAFSASDLCIAPLIYGAGVKIKVLQMLDSGAYVISTPVGAEGISEHENLKIVSMKLISDEIKFFLMNR